MATTRLKNPATGATVAAERRKLTFSTWVKRCSLPGDQLLFSGWTHGSYWCYIGFDGDGYIRIRQYAGGSNPFYLKTNRKFRDLSAWYHIVMGVDTTLGTSTDRIKLYVNGVRETSFSQTTYPSQNFDTYWGMTAGGDGYPSYIGGDGASGSFLDGYMADTYGVGNQQYDASVFGSTDSTTGEWKPNTDPSITYGTGVAGNFHLKFDDSSNFGKNYATGFTSNHWSVDNGTLTKTEDNPSSVFATWNSLFRKGTSTPAFSNGNLTSTFDNAGANEFALTTLGASSGKYYAEIKWVSATGTGATSTGILDMGYSGTADPNNAVTNTFAYFGNGNKNVSGSASSYGSSYTSGDIIGIAMDLDNNKLYFSKNGTWQNSGVPTSGSTGTGAIPTIAGVTYGFMTSDYNNKVCQLNTGNGFFGTTAVSSAGTNASNNGIFEYDVPSGYTALSTKGLNL